ncbi:predicted protein [Uncinocarpus reesii 1704]|uniref:Protein transport protein sec16 n=1 Tax=Uncinocarpus reesii (strain UAMH 1704) TaxID=336963 RepID=C4JR72_UNCRE|nr:uncharacterized protein UREG_03554 [Uncinocarpus reesii 1704]EEP78708.1 predicted protein [Uncinocarpus reesii 1704]
MAEVSVLGHGNGSLPDALQYGAWNPAHRPEQLSNETDRDDPPASSPTFGQIGESAESSPGNTSSKSLEPEKPVVEPLNSDSTHLGELSKVAVESRNHGIMDSNIIEAERFGFKQNVDLAHSDSPLIDSFQGSEAGLLANSFSDDSVDFQAMIGATLKSKQDNSDKGDEESHQPLSDPQPPNNTNAGDSPWNNTFAADEEGGAGFFNNISSQTKPIYNPPEPESRFEEGLPLIDNSDAQSLVNSHPVNAIDTLFEADEATGDADFFSSQMTNQKESTWEQPSGLERKSTSQVLSGLNVTPYANAAPQEPAANEDVGEEELAERWKAFLDDDDLLIENEPLDASTNDSGAEMPKYRTEATEHLATPNTSQFQPQSSTANPYAPHQPSLSEMLACLPSSNSFSAPQQVVKPEKGPVESFVNQPKAGYQSPFDLPFEMRPKHAVTRAVKHPPGMNPPPRSSSMTGSRPPSSSYMPSSPEGTGGLPNAAPPHISNSDTVSPSTKAPVRTGSFFEELPVVTRSRPSTRGRHASQPNPAEQPPNAPIGPMVPPPASHPQQNRDPYSQFQLQPPAPVDLYSTLPVPPSQHPPQSSRYSPQPPSQPATKSAPFPRYSPAPPQLAGTTGPPTYVSQSPTVQTSVTTRPFQPRTSSPLAYHEPTMPYSSPPRKREPLPVTSTVPPTSRLPPLGPDSQIIPPKRSMTQSPGKMNPLQTSAGSSQNAYVRPASAHGGRSSMQTFQTAYTPAVHNRSVPVLDFIPPTDGREHDPLQRWKGAPIFRFGFGGSVLSTFPKHIPRYSTGQMVPRIKPTLGDIKIYPINQLLPHDEPLDKFPGPLKSKSKKKDVLTWLSTMISAFETLPVEGPAQTDLVQERRREDTILLWKVVRVLVEHDGVLGGSTAADASLQSVFSQNDATTEAGPLDTQSGYPDANRPLAGSLTSEPASSLGVETIHKNLVSGDRQKAVWDAVDHRLWGHAMLISSTLDKSVWKQVVQEFIRREVRSLGQNTESLAALYEIFAGNFEESIDELVPPSARAGLQMVSMHAGPGPAKDALEGLNKWKETVNLILKNRSSQDHQALLALGRLLASYGRTEAAHVCCLIAGAKTRFGGVHDPQADIVLLGSNHRLNSSATLTDRKAYLLTEVYEFATSVLATAPSPVLPHLQAFKLQHAMHLAEEGHKSEAQHYCEAIVSIVTSKSNAKSPYYHQTFFAQLDELLQRLRQAPADGSSSWISKPSMEKVSGSVWAKFNSFVAGDDNEVASNGSGKAGEGDIGPFAKIAGTPPVSRSPSVVEGYGSYFPSQQVPPSSSSSRYAPNNQHYPPYSSPEQSRGRRSLDSQRSPSHNAARSYSQRRNSQDPMTPLENNGYGLASSNIHASPAGISSHFTPPQPNYSPLAPVKEIYSPQVQSPTSETPAAQLSTTSFGISQESSLPLPATAADDHEAKTGAMVPEQPQYQPPTYEPPSLSTGYEPPSYSTDVAEGEESEEVKPKKKSFMDDDGDDDFMARAAQLRSVEKVRINREADEAFKKAAEADAKRPPTAEKKGWFSGWFGKKEAGPVRADLGDDNAFYFDKELNRWINKNDSGGTAAAAATPPPPKGSAPSSRSASAAQTPTTPNLVNGRPGPSTIAGVALSAPTGIPPLPTPPLSSLGPATGSPRPIPRSVSAGAPTGPPSRPSTSLSNASSIDDLLGAPQARKAGTVKARKKGRGYIDVMAK